MNGPRGSRFVQWARLRNVVVTLAQMATVATGTVFYRKTAGTGIPEVQTLATLKTDLAVLTTIGSAGTDVALAGQTLNVPDASGTARGVITTGTQTIAGVKTFTSVVNASAYFYAGTGLFVNLKAGFQSPSDGVMTLRSWVGVGDFILQFGNTTNAAAAIKRIGTLLEIKLADDSAYTDLKCLTLEATAGAKIVKRTVTTASAASITPNADITDIYPVTAQAAGLTINNPTGTLTNYQQLMIRIKDNGTARALSFGANFRAIGVTLPITTVLGKTLYIGSVWNSTDSKWDVLAVGQEA